MLVCFSTISDTHDINLTRRNKNLGWTVSRFRNRATPCGNKVADGFKMWKLVDGRLLEDYKLVKVSSTDVMMTEPEESVKILMLDHRAYVKARKKMAHYDAEYHKEEVTDLNDLEDEANNDPMICRSHS